MLYNQKDANCVSHRSECRFRGLQGSRKGCLSVEKVTPDLANVVNPRLKLSIESQWPALILEEIVGMADVE